MELNVFKIKKYAVLCLSTLLPVTFFFVANTFYNFWIGLLALLVAGLLVFIFGNLLLKNPFTEMLEGKGLLILNIDSTGIIRPFICSIEQPYIKGKIGKNIVDDVYDRDSVYNLANAEKKGVAIIENTEEGNKKITITLDETEFNKSRFGLFHYPVLIYNSQVKSLLTKDYLSEKEKDAFAVCVSPCWGCMRHPAFSL